MTYLIPTGSDHWSAVDLPELAAMFPTRACAVPAHRFRLLDSKTG